MDLQDRFAQAYKGYAKSSSSMAHRSQQSSISSLASMASTESEDANNSSDFDFEGTLQELQGDESLPAAVDSRSVKLGSSHKSDSKKQFDKSVESPFDFMTTSTGSNGFQHAAQSSRNQSTRAAHCIPRAGSPYPSTASSNGWNPSASLEAQPVPSLPSNGPINAQEFPVASSSTDPLLLYVLSRKKIPSTGLPPRQPLMRSQSDFTTPSTGSSALNTSQNGSLYRSTLAKQHARSDSANSNNSDDLSAGLTTPTLDQGVDKGKKLETGLETVDLTHKKAMDLPVTVIKELIGSVQRLALSYNRIQKLPAEFSQLGTTLKYLNLRGNHMVVFPTVLTEMPSLEILDVSKNKIEKLPKTCGTLRSLKVLSIKENAIRKLPSYFAQMIELRVLKIDHNPIVWPPREIVAFPSDLSPFSTPMERASSNESYLSATHAKAKDGDAQIMQKWLGNLQSWMANNPMPEKRSASSGLSRTLRSDSMKAAVSSEEEEQPTRYHSSSSARSMPRLNKKPSSIKLSAVRLKEVPSPLPSPSLPVAVSATIPKAANSQPQVDQDAKQTLHSRNASATFPNAQSRFIPPSTSALRSKKSLPDLRLGQSSASLFTTSSSGTAPTTATSNFSASQGPGRSVNFIAPYDRPRPSLMDATTSENKSGNRDSRAYFARLSTLPPSTSSKAVPPALLEFIDAIRGILFALSQIYTGLRQFAEHDRLPVALTKMMATADLSLGRLINSLDRFDSTSRKWTTFPEVGTVREVFESCKENVAIFSKLVSVLSIQLKSLVGEADVRYTRTLLLMLYGSLGEVGTAWKIMAPKAQEVAAMVRETESGTPATLQTSLHPPTPSPKTEEIDAFIPASSTSSISPRSTPTPNGLPPPLPLDRGGKARRHAGSFSVEDVNLGAMIPPAATSPVSESALSDSPTAVLPLPFSSSSATQTTPAVSTTGRARPLAPNLTTSGVSLPYMDVMATLEGQPPTPVGPLPPMQIHGGIRSHRTRPSIEGPARVAPLNVSHVSRARQGSSSSRSLVSQYSTIQGVDNDYLEMAESTTAKAFGVCSMLADALAEYGQSGKHVELTNLCEVTSDAARRLQGAIEVVRHDQPELAVGNRKLNEDSHAFAQSVIQFALLAKELSQDLQFSRSVREGLSQLAKMTNSLLAMLSVTTFSR